LSEQGLLGFGLIEISPYGWSSGGVSLMKSRTATGLNQALTYRVPAVRLSVQRVEVLRQPKSLQPLKVRPLSGTAVSVTRVGEAKWWMQASCGDWYSCASVWQLASGAPSAGEIVTVPGPAVVNSITISVSAVCAGVDAPGNPSATRTPAAMAARRFDQLARASIRGPLCWIELGTPKQHRQDIADDRVPGGSGRVKSASSAPTAHRIG
jgi:hypothetical protein